MSDNQKVRLSCILTVLVQVISVIINNVPDLF